MFEDLNMWAIIASAFACVAIGSVWYSPKTPTGKAWVRLSGVSMGNDKGVMKAMSLGFMTALVFSTVLAIVLRIANAITITDAVTIATLVWVGFIVPIYYGAVIWESKPHKLFFLYVGYELIRAVVVAMILVSL